MVYNSNGVNYSYIVNQSEGVTHSGVINESKGISYSNFINESSGIKNCVMASKCNGLSDSFFCYNTSGQYKLFNKQITKRRFKAIEKIMGEVVFEYSEYMGDCENREDGEQGLVILGKFKLSKKVMTKIKQLPEYDKNIFNKLIREMHTFYFE